MSDKKHHYDLTEAIEIIEKLKAERNAAMADAKRFVFMANQLDPGMYLVDGYTPCDYYDDDAGISRDVDVWRLCVDAAIKESRKTMSNPLNDEYQNMAANAICHAAAMAGEAIQQSASCHSEPSAIYRPKISIDGDQWCALYGDDLQSGVAGFGKSPADAMIDFNKAWYAPLKGKS